MFSSICYVQENIELAKRDWELSHLQALREEEEKIAEEEAVEDVHLTYDRPDLCNKVTLRRTSTGVWKVCSSGQNNSRLSYSAKAIHKERPAQKVDSKETETSDIRELRSGKALGSEAATSSVQDPVDDPCVRPARQDVEDDPDYMPVKHLKDVNMACVDRSSTRSLWRYSEVSGDSSSRTNFSCRGDVHMSGEGFAESKVVVHKWGESSGPIVPCSNGSSENSTTSNLGAHNNSTVSHKYPTRQKSSLQNDGDV